MKPAFPPSADKFGNRVKMSIFQRKGLPSAVKNACCTWTLKTSESFAQSEALANRPIRLGEMETERQGDLRKIMTIFRVDLPY